MKLTDKRQTGRAWCVLGIIFLLCVAGCGLRKSAGGAVKLRPSHFVGHSLSLVSDSQVEQYTFVKSGEVLAVIGNKEAVASPVFYWRIDDRTLFITDTPGGKDMTAGQSTMTIPFQFRLLTRTNAITVDGRRFHRRPVP